MNKTQTKKKRSVVTDNFLEALRGTGTNVAESVARDLLGGTADTAIDQLTGRKRSGALKSNETLDLEALQKQENLRKQLNQEFFQIRQEERLVFKQTEQKTQLEIKAIQEELKNLVESTKNLVKEVEIAAKVEPVEPGVYHFNFFERLRQTIILFKKRIEESADWLSLFNQRSKKRGHYWNQVKKSGTKFMLSQERYMATQAG